MNRTQQFYLASLLCLLAGVVVAAPSQAMSISTVQQYHFQVPLYPQYRDLVTSADGFPIYAV